MNRFFAQGSQCSWGAFWTEQPGPNTLSLFIAEIPLVCLTNQAQDNTWGKMNADQGVLVNENQWVLSTEKCILNHCVIAWVLDMTFWGMRKGPLFLWGKWVSCGASRWSAQQLYNKGGPVRLYCDHWWCHDRWGQQLLLATSVLGAAVRKLGCLEWALEGSSCQIEFPNDKIRVQENLIEFDTVSQMIAKRWSQCKGDCGDAGLVASWAADIRVQGPWVGG